MLNLNSVLIGSEDPKALADFYRNILGEPRWDDQGFIGWQVGSGSFMVGPHSDVKGRNESPGRILVFFETPDVQAEFKRIKDKGVTVVREPYHPDEQPELWLATLEDPDGNYFQLASPMPENM